MAPGISTPPSGRTASRLIPAVVILTVFAPAEKIPVVGSPVKLSGGAPAVPRFSVMVFDPPPQPAAGPVQVPPARRKLVVVLAAPVAGTTPCAVLVNNVKLCVAVAGESPMNWLAALVPTNLAEAGILPPFTVVALVPPPPPPLAVW